MSKYKLFFLYALLLLLVPSILPAVPMGGMGGSGGMGGMGGVAQMVDKIEIQTKDVGAVIFRHSIHGTNCSMCHPRLFQKKANSNHVTMKHMERGRSCGGCHNGRAAFSVTENCTTCHAGDIDYKDTGAGDVTFSHEVHTGMFGCEECHPDLFKAKRGTNKATMEDMEGGMSCGVCHDGSTAFGVAEECEGCHQM